MAGYFRRRGSLTRNVSTLRKVLGEAPDGQNYIGTVPRRGYRFVAQVHQTSTAGQPKLPSGKPAILAQRGTSPTWAASQASHISRIQQKAPAIVWCGRRDALTQAQSRSIAVEPLESIFGDAVQNHFAQILTEALLSELARIRNLRVVRSMAVPRLSGEQGTGVPVDLLVGGAVIRVGHQMRIVLSLTTSNTGAELWSRSYERELGEVQSRQEEVACVIADEVRASLTPHESDAVLVRPEAYDAYLRGRFYASRQNRDDNETAVRALERAVALDPTFAVAYAELAQTYTWKLFLFSPNERHWEEDAFVAVEKALSLDANLAVAYVARGRLLWTQANHFPHVKAVREYRRALALDPDLDEARNQLALIYSHIGYFDDALRESREAAATNPNNHLAVYRIAQTLAFQGKFEEALDLLQAIRQEVNPSLIGYQTAWVLFNLKNREEASATIEQLLQKYPEDDGALFLSMQAILAAAAGAETTARAKIKLAIRTGKGFGHFHHTAYHIAVAFALMNDVEDAVHWLEAASRDGFPCYPLFQSDANLDSLRQDSRFHKFMEKLRHHWLGYRSMV